MGVIKTAKCPTGCPDGLVLGSSGKLLRCSVCHGTGIVTPRNICYCGQSCTTTKEKIIYCGDDKCFQGLKSSLSAKPVHHSTVQQWNMDHWD